MKKLTIAAFICLAMTLAAGAAQAQSRDGIPVIIPGYGPSLIMDIGEYKVMLGELEGALAAKGGFKITLMQTKELHKWIDTLVQTMGKHPDKKYLFQGPFNVVNVRHKLFLINFYREAKNKNLQDVSMELMDFVAAMENVRIKMLEEYGLVVVI